MPRYDELDWQRGSGDDSAPEHCDYQRPPPPAPWPSHAEYRLAVQHGWSGVPSSTLAVWALVLGVVGILAGWCLLGLPNLAAIVLGHLGVNDTKDGRKTGRGMAITGLVLGYVGVLPAVILFFWMVVGGLGAAVTPSPSPSMTLFPR